MIFIFWYFVVVISSLLGTAINIIVNIFYFCLNSDKGVGNS